MPKLAYLDIETGGLDPFQHDILEVAYLRDVDEVEVDVTHFSLALTEWKRANPTALKINKYEERKDELGEIRVTPMYAAAKLLVELEDYIIVGSNPQFDLTFMRVFLHERGMGEPTWHYRCIDLNTLAAGHMGLATPLKTPEIAEQFNVPLPKDQHTALADATWNMAAYRAIVRD